MVKILLKKGIKLALVEQTNSSKTIYDMSWEFPICFIVGNRRGSQSDLEGNFDLILLCLAQIQIRMWKSGEYPDLWWGLFIVVA